jgi:hypothetical protein
MTHITPVPWYRVEPYSQVFSEIDAQLYTVLNVDTSCLPHLVTAVDPFGKIVMRTVEPWSNAHTVHPSNEGEAIVNLAQKFDIEGATTINER